MAIVLVMFSVAPAAAQSSPSPDAKTYAALNGVGLAEANRRFELQAAAGQLERELGVTEASTFAGLWLQHKPSFRVVAAFTRDADATLQRHVSGTQLAAIAEARTVRYSFAKLRQDLTELMWAATSRTADLLVDVTGNRVEVRVLSAAEFRRQVQQRGARIPDSVVIVEVPALARPATDLYGGLPVDGSQNCTSGFGVNHNGTADRGITTAGHCPNDMSYSGTSLTFQSENTGYDNDEQWHTGWQFTIRNWIQDSPTTHRDITSRTMWSSQSVGGFVCKYGRNAGYACGYIWSKVTTGCLGSSGSEYIYVQSQGEDLVKGGDSGGPVFLVNSAYGSISCDFNLDFSYVATDHLEGGIGVTILTAP